MFRATRPPAAKVAGAAAVVKPLLNIATIASTAPRGGGVDPSQGSITGSIKPAAAAMPKPRGRAVQALRRFDDPVLSAVSPAFEPPRLKAPGSLHATQRPMPFEHANLVHSGGNGDAAEAVANTCPTTDVPIPRVAAELHAALADFRARHGFGRALSAPMIGYNVRLIAMQLVDDEPVTMFNPQIHPTTDTKRIVWANCFSHPDRVVRVARHEAVGVQYYDALDPHGGIVEWFRLNFGVSELLQREVDHLDGKLPIHAAHPLTQADLDAGPRARREAAAVVRAAIDAHHAAEGLPPVNDPTAPITVVPRKVKDAHPDAMRLLVGDTMV